VLDVLKCWRSVLEVSAGGQCLKKERGRSGVAVVFSVDVKLVGL
jgi:hypothetical protein